MHAQSAQPAKILVWDAAVRVVHWLLVLTFAVSWWTAENGQLQYHRYSGYTLLGLLIFRIYWGFAGSSTARFGNFLRSPRAALSYLTGSVRRSTSATVHIGHNPAGGWSVLAMLVLLTLQVGLGLFAVDVDGIESGPLSYLVSFEVGRSCAEWHETVFNLLLVIVGAHIAAVLFYLWYRRENLIKSMLVGTRESSNEPATGVPAVSASPWLIVIGVLLAAAGVWLVAR